MLAPLTSESPRTDFWICFKVANKDRLLQMQRGLIYMNSLSYFSELPDEAATAARKDEMEEVFAVLHAGEYNGVTRNIEFSYGSGDDRKTIDAGAQARLKIKFPRPEEVLIYCMGAFSIQELADLNSGELVFDDKFREFGDHVLVIKNSMQFSQRIQHAMDQDTRLYSNPLVNSSHGLVDYEPMDGGAVVKGLFIKPDAYSWQREFRFSFSAPIEALNQDGAYELQIGSIKDISDIVPLQDLISRPMRFKRRRYRMDSGVPKLVE